MANNVDPILSVRLIIKGKVQGVFYRQSTCEKANALGLTGFVMNLSNGDVLIEAHGTPTKVEELYEWSKKGPRLAKVNEVSREEITPTVIYEKFIFRKEEREG